jgi:hypothetical protein
VIEGQQDGRLTETPMAVALVELERRALGEGREVQVLALEVAGKLVDPARLGELGLDGAPFPSMPTRFGVLREGAGEKLKVWLLEGHTGVSSEQLTRALKEPSMVDLARPVPRFEALGRLPGDSPVRYRKTVKQWPSRCEGFEHPAPESGDFFFSERCFHPEAGLTRIGFSSVWGGYRFELIDEGSTR